MALTNAETRARYYEKYKAKHVQGVTALKKAKKEYLQTLKASTPCTDCGGSFPYYVMDFDHCRGDKSFDIGNAHRFGWQVIHDEVAKCDIVCKNCHAERTHSRGYAC